MRSRCDATASGTVRSSACMRSTMPRGSARSICCVRGLRCSVTRGSTTREVTAWGGRNSERSARVVAIDPRVRRLTYRPPFDTGKPFGADVRRFTLALLTTLVALPLTGAHAQIIRGGLRLRDPQTWVSAMLGWQNGWTVFDGTTASRWDLGDSQ